MADWSKQVYFEDVKAGDEVPFRSVPLTLQRLVMEISADYVFAPHHYDNEFCRSIGLEAAFANTMFVEMLFEITVQKWMGLDGWLRELGPMRMGQPAYVGDNITCRGRVKATEESDGLGLVRLELTQESERGVTAQTEAVVKLPRRRVV